jgi:hypothetical protein
MPNWCSNIIEIEGTKEQITKLVSFLDENNGKDWFDFFLPTPTELKEEGWYEWNIENWGTKWNCDAQDWVKVESPIEDLATVSFWFDSAWAPPITLYEKIESTSTLNIKASYSECGMGFVGEFVDGCDDCYNYQSLEDLDDIPEHLVDEWNLAEQMEMNEEENDE